MLVNMHVIEVCEDDMTLIEGHVFFHKHQIPPYQYGVSQP